MSASLDIHYRRDSVHMATKVNWMKPDDLHFHQKSAFIWLGFVSHLQSGNNKTAHSNPTLKTMSSTKEMYLSGILFSCCHDISRKILPGLLLNLSFLSSVRCMLGENDCVNHQTCGGWSRLMLLKLQDDARAVARLQLLKSHVFWANLGMRIWSEIVIILAIEWILNGQLRPPVRQESLFRRALSDAA